MDRTPERGARWRRAAILLGVLLLASVSAVVARWILFTHFSTWDDEGYFLLALRAYAKGEVLYDRVDVFYGPLYFQVWTGISRLLGIPLDNVSARTFALLVWVGASLGCLALVLRITRSVLAATVAYLLCFPLLVVLRNEPLHPSHSIVFLTPILAFVALGALGREGPARSSCRWAVCGALVASLFLMKVNVGAFALLAFTVAFLRKTPGSLGRAVAFLLLIATPFLLMRRLFSIPWVADLALLEAVSLAPFGLMSTSSRTGGERASIPKQALAFASGGILVAIVVLAIACSAGSTLAGMWRVLVVETLRFPAMFALAPELPPRGFLIGAVALQLVVAALHREWLVPAQKRQSALVILKLLVAAALLFLYGSTHWLLAGLPFVWLMTLPVGEDRESGAAPPSTWLIGLLVVAISLQVFPVAGTQIQLATFLVPALVVIGLHDSFRALRGRRLLAGIGVAAVATAALVAHPFYGSLPSVRREYAHEKIALDLPGAESLRLSEGEVTVFRWLVANLNHHGATFFGVPGLHSLYGWAEEEPPVPFYANAWMISTPPARQLELARIIAARPDLCIVRHPRTTRIWLRERSFPSSPIALEVEQDFKVAGQVGGYELLIPNAKESDLILSATPAPLPAETPEADRERVALRLSIPALAGARLHRLELVQARSGKAVCDSRAANREERMLFADGTRLPLDLSNRSDLMVLCPPRISTPGAGWLLIRCYDERGEIVARLPVVQ